MPFFHKISIALEKCNFYPAFTLEKCMEKCMKYTSKPLEKCKTCYIMSSCYIGKQKQY